MSSARSPRERAPIGDTAFLSELDASFLVPCKRCVSLLRAREQSCPFCGADQSVTDEAGDGWAVIDPGLGTSVGRRARARIAMDSVVMRWPTGQEAVGHPIATDVPEQENLELDLLHPSAPWQKRALESRGSGRQRGGAVARDRLLISIAAALVLFALVPVLDHAHLGTRNETGELREFGTNLERVQSALGPGDLGVEERGLDLLDTRRAGEPGLQTFREALHRQVREQAQREQLATPEASKIIPLGAAAVSGVSPTSPLSLATPSSEIAMPAPEARVADPRKKECSEALAALALCPEK